MVVLVKVRLVVVLMVAVLVVVIFNIQFKKAPAYFAHASNPLVGNQGFYYPFHHAWAVIFIVSLSLLVLYPFPRGSALLMFRI